MLACTPTSASPQCSSSARSLSRRASRRCPGRCRLKLLGTRRRLPASLLGVKRATTSMRGRARCGISPDRHSLSDPIRGIGGDRFPSYASSRSGVGAIATHDEFTRFAAELGLPGLIALAIICAAAAHAALAIRRRPEAPALLGMLVASAICLCFPRTSWRPPPPDFRLPPPWPARSVLPSASAPRLGGKVA